MRFAGCVYAIIGLYLGAASQRSLAQATPPTPPEEASAPVASPAAPTVPQEPAPPAPRTPVPYVESEVPPPPPAAGPDTRPPAAAAPVAQARAEDAETAADRRDFEQPRLRLVDPDAEARGVALRIGLGVAAALWFSGGDAALWKPISLSIDLGYTFNRRIAAIVRASTWLKTNDLAHEYLGAGVTYHFAPENMYVSGTLGALVTRTGPSLGDAQHHLQGLALQIDVAQAFPIATWSELAVGAHFLFGTPLGGTKPDAFTSIETGIFIAFGLR